MDRPHEHPPTADLVRLHRRELPLAVVEEQEIASLNSICPDCARIREEFLKRRSEIAAAADPAAEAERARLESLAMQTRLEADRRIAEIEVERLLNLDREERTEAVKAIQRARKRYRTPAFVERLIVVSRVWLRHDCGEALWLLDIAEGQVPRIPRAIYGDRLVDSVALRVLAHQGNTLRVAGNLRASEEKYQEVRERLGGKPIDDPALLGELANLQASLLYDQRRFEQEKALLDEAARCFREVGDGPGLAKVLIKRGSIHYAGQDHAQAIPWYEAAAAAVTFDADPHVALSARHNLVLCLCAVGQAAAARELLEESRALYMALGDPTTLNLLCWAEGKIAAGCGEDEAALERLRAARDAYAERGLEYDASLVSLDLTEVHLQRGETAEVKRLADCMARAFADRGVDHEAARAVSLFHKAARAEAVTLDLISRTRQALLRIRDRPARWPR